MQFADRKTGVRYLGTLVEDPEVDYRRLVLVLTPLEGGPTLRLDRHDKHRLVLTEAKLDEISRLDGAGFSFPLHPALRRRRSAR